MICEIEIKWNHYILKSREQNARECYNVILANYQCKKEKYM